MGVVFHSLKAVNLKGASLIRMFHFAQVFAGSAATNKPTHGNNDRNCLSMFGSRPQPIFQGHDGRIIVQKEPAIDCVATFVQTQFELLLQVGDVE